MKCYLAALIFATLNCQVIAAVLKSHLKSVPNGWKQGSVTPDHKTLTLTVALQHQNEDTFYTKLDQISNPNHDSYGTWMDKESVNDLLRPSATSKAAVLSWLQQHGITDIKSDDFYIYFATNVRTANKLLDAKYQNFHYNGMTKIRTRSYSLPSHLGQHISLVSPTTYLGKPTPSRIIFEPTFDENIGSSAAADNCSLGLTPSCIKNYYNIKYTATKDTKSRMAFASFLNQSAFQSDLNLYIQKNNLQPQNFTTVLINGGVDNQDPSNSNSGEANLDAQNMVAVAQPIPLTQFITGRQFSQKPRLNCP